MNKDRLKKLLYDLELEYKDIEESLKFIQVYSDNELLKKELSNSLKYKYLSMFILYEDFISMLLKEYNMTRQRRVVMRKTRNLEYKRQIANTQKMVIESKCLLEICLTFFKIRNIIS